MKKYRKLIINETELSADACKEQLVKSGYVVITGTDSKEKIRETKKGLSEDDRKKAHMTICLLIDVDSHIVSDSGTIGKVIDAIYKKYEKYNVEFILITRDDIGSNIWKKLENYTTPTFHSRHELYQTFLLELPLHPSNGECHILTKEEEKIMLAEAMCEKNQLKQAKDMDKLMFWIGAEKGNIVRVVFPSKTNGRQIEFYATS